MCFQPVSESKTFPTTFYWTHKRQFMHLLVPVKLRLGEECLAANLTQVWFLSRVYIHVICKLSRMIEFLATDITYMFSFHCSQYFLCFVEHLCHLAQACIQRIDVEKLWRGFHIRLVVGHQFTVCSKQFFCICSFQVFELDPSPFGHCHLLLGFLVPFFFHLQCFHKEFLGVAFIFFFQKA